MKMLKVTLGTLITIFCIVSLIVVFYWRDIGFEPTSKDLIVFFILCPALLTLCILSPLYIMKWLEFRKNKADSLLEDSNQSDDVELKNIDAEPTWTKLSLYASSCLHAFGENQDIKSEIQKFLGPELDNQLTNPYGLSIVSYRIKDLELLEITEDIHQSELQLRLMSLINGQFESYYSEIQAVIAHIKKSTLFYDRQLAYEYKIHPAWIHDDHSDLTSDVVEEEIPEEVSRLSYLNIHIVLTEAVLHSFDEAMVNEFIEESLFDLGILKQQVRLYFHYWNQKSAYSNWVNLLKSFEILLDEFSFIIVADTEINQEILDEKTYVRENYIPAEFACGCLISSPNLVVENLTPIKNLYIIENENNLNNSLEKLNIQNAPQFENEQPFVVLLDSIDAAKISKQINQFFSSTLIETQHFLLSKQSLGHTQTLSEIWGMMLGTQLAEDEFNLVFSTKYPEIQVFILPYEPNNSAVKD
jgi:hypothetical protein